MAVIMDKKHDPVSESLEPSVESGIEEGDVSNDLDLLGKLCFLCFIRTLADGSCQPDWAISKN